MHLGMQKDFTIAFSQPVEDIVFYLRENGGNATIDFGLTPIVVSGGQNLTINGTQIRPNTLGGAVRFENVNSRTITHTATVPDGLNMAFYVESVAPGAVTPVSCVTDADGDGIADEEDNCINFPNADQSDADGDGQGDACDACPNDPDNDIDGDGVCGDVDNCPTVANTDQSDADGDGQGDACDACPNDPDNDIDGDGVCGDVDNCPTVANADQSDADGDGQGDACDACPNDPDNDIDGDGVCGDVDNCPGIANPNQEDLDDDGLGDVCDDDIDGDGLLNNCDIDDFVDNYVWPGFENMPVTWLCGNNNNKVKVCHVPPGNPANAHTICVSPNAVPAHIGNHAGDYLGECTCTGQNLMAPGSNVNTATAIEHLELEVFPNPANGKVNIHLHGLEGEAMLTIYDHLGRTVWSQQLEDVAHALQLDLNLENGIYLVSVTSNGERMTQRLVIAK